MSLPESQTELTEQDTVVPCSPSLFAEIRDVNAEFHALLEGCGVVELAGRAHVSVTGADRTRWLNGMISNNIRDLAVGSGVYAFLLSPQGRIMSDMRAYNRGESLFLDIDLSHVEKVLSLLRRYIIMDKVEITDLSKDLKAIAVVGPKSREMLGAIGLDLPVLEPLQSAEVNWREWSFTVIRGDRPRVQSHEISGEFVGALQQALQSSGAIPVGAEAFNLLRIAEGIPRYGEDIRERDLPQETGQNSALNFSKGCYIGQEIVERIRSRGNVHRKFTGFEVHGKLPEAGAKIQIDSKDVGEITSTACLPLRSGPYPVALGYIRREVENSGKQIAIEDTLLTVADLPFQKVFEN